MSAEGEETGFPPALLTAWASHCGLDIDDDRVRRPDLYGWPSRFRVFREGYEAAAAPALGMSAKLDAAALLKENSGKAIIEGDSIVIRVAIDALQSIAEGGWASNCIPTRIVVKDAQVYAKELVHILNEHSENGTTRIHRLFDGAIQHATEFGAEGIDVHEQQGG